MDTRNWDNDRSLKSRFFPLQTVVTLSVLIAWPLSVLAAWDHFVLIVWLLSVLTVWLIIFAVSRWRQVPSSTNRLAGPARVLAAAALLMIVVFILWAAAAGTTDFVRNFGYHPSIRQWFIIPYLIAPIAILVLYLAHRAWRERWWSLLARVHYSLVALSVVWSLAYLRIWGFIG